MVYSAGVLWEGIMETPLEIMNIWQIHTHPKKPTAINCNVLSCIITREKKVETKQNKPSLSIPGAVIQRLPVTAPRPSVHAFRFFFFLTFILWPIALCQTTNCFWNPLGFQKPFS